MATAFDQQPSNLQGVRSPIVVTLDDTNSILQQFLYALDVFAWSGDPSSIPATRIERLKKPPLANTVASFNIAPLLRSLFTDLSRPDQFTEITAAGEMILNLALMAGYEASGTTDYANATSSTYLITQGFAEFNEGINYDKTANAMTSRTGTMFIREQGYEFLPFLWDTNNDVTAVRFSDNISTTVDIPIATYLGQKGSVSDSDNKAGYIPIGVQAMTDWNDASAAGALGDFLNGELKYVALLNSVDDVLQSWNVEVVCESHFTPGTIYFVNKFGMWDWISFFKKSAKTQERTAEEYMRARSTYSSDQLQSELSTPEYQEYNVSGMENIRVTTGYQDGDLTTLVKELMLSEHVLLQVGTERPRPVKLTSASQPLKTVTNDNIVSYDLEFKYAYNTVSTLGA